jgi:hypothetical protein
MQVVRKSVVEAVQSALDVYDAWEATDGPMVQWRGGEVKTMSLAVANAFDGLCGLCAATEADDDAKEVVLALDALQQELTAWKEAGDVAYESVHPSGTPELRACIAALREAIAPQPIRLPENIRELVESGVGDEQICKMYGFLDANGNVDLVKLSQEKREPGKHFNPDTWQPPWMKRRQREINERWERRVSVVHTPIGEQPPAPRQVAPESIDDLLAQNVGAEQIALMKGMTVEAVEAYAREQGVPVAGRTVRAPAKTADAQTDLAKRRAELQGISHPEILDMQERIAACFLDDMKSADIATALQADYPDLTVHKVAALIREFKKADAQVAS